MSILAFVGFNAASATFDYRRQGIGEFQPPVIPLKDKHPHLNGPVPPPETGPLSLLQVAVGADPPAGGAKKLPGLRSASNPIGSKVPAHWYGRGPYIAPGFAIASGKEECDVCAFMINNYVEDKPKRKEEFLYPGPSKGGAAPAPAPASPAPGSPPPPGMEFKKLINNVDLCEGINPKYQEMCDGFEEYLIACPSFTNDICHQDLGGMEQLRSPCPDYLKCYYCLRINPLYCLDHL